MCFDTPQKKEQKRKTLVRIVDTHNFLGNDQKKEVLQKGHWKSGQEIFIRLMHQKKH